MFNRIQLIVVCFLSSFSFSAFATWPVFMPPDKAFLIDNHFIDTAHCPTGYGKISTGLSINIHNSLCSTYCPDNWVWLASTDEKCHNLKTEFEFQGYTVTHYNDGDGNTLYSQVTALYGEKDSALAIYSFTFTSPQENWYCAVMNPALHTLTCANDLAVMKINHRN